MLPLDSGYRLRQMLRLRLVLSKPNEGTSKRPWAEGNFIFRLDELTAEQSDARVQIPLTVTNLRVNEAPQFWRNVCKRALLGCLLPGVPNHKHVEVHLRKANAREVVGLSNPFCQVANPVYLPRAERNAVVVVAKRICLPSGKCLSLKPLDLNRRRLVGPSGRAKQDIDISQVFFVGRSGFKGYTLVNNHIVRNSSETNDTRAPTGVTQQ